MMAQLVAPIVTQELLTSTGIIGAIDSMSYVNYLRSEHMITPHECSERLGYTAAEPASPRRRLGVPKSRNPGFTQED